MVAWQASESPACLNFVRFGIAALVLSPFSPGLSSKMSPTAAADADKTANSDADADASPAVVWRAGAELGLWMFLGFAFQSIGLLFTTASRSAFLLYLNVKLVPIFSAVLFGRAVPGLTWASAAVALFGTEPEPHPVGAREHAGLSGVGADAAGLAPRRVVGELAAGVARRSGCSCSPWLSMRCAAVIRAPLMHEPP